MRAARLAIDDGLAAVMPEEIVGFWFGSTDDVAAAGAERCGEPGSAADRALAARFGGWIERRRRARRLGRDSARGLALVLLLDQLPRSCSATRRAPAYDAQALPTACVCGRALTARCV
jgi:uncharacterized protein (DUF924 family)